jgi:uncharacterized cupin superfamily protein
MREIHWHPNADEWQFYIAGKARMTVFGASTNSRTFDYRAGDVGTVPKAMAHFAENTGDSPLRFVELFRAPSDYSLGFVTEERSVLIRWAKRSAPSPFRRCRSLGLFWKRGASAAHQARRDSVQIDLLGPDPIG